MSKTDEVTEQLYRETKQGRDLLLSGYSRETLKGLCHGQSVFTCFQILKPIMNKWAQYPAQMEG